MHQCHPPGSCYTTGPFMSSFMTFCEHHADRRDIDALKRDGIWIDMRVFPQGSG